MSHSTESSCSSPENSKAVCSGSTKRGSKRRFRFSFRKKADFGNEDDQTFSEHATSDQGSHQKEPKPQSSLSIRKDKDKGFDKEKTSKFSERARNDPHLEQIVSDLEQHSFSDDEMEAFLLDFIDPVDVMKKILQEKYYCKI